LHPDKSEAPRGSVAVIRPLLDASSILARAAERRAVRQADHDAAMGDLQELVSVTSAPVAASQRIAERVDMSTSACWQRVRALEEAGIITRIS
jgi:hypothetical protein